MYLFMLKEFDNLAIISARQILPIAQGRETVANLFYWMYKIWACVLAARSLRDTVIT